MAEKKEDRFRPNWTVAADTLTPHKDNVAADAAKRAKGAGVAKPYQVDYAEALGNYEAREDVETLANRRAREVGTTFEENDHHRKRPDVESLDEGGTVTAVPQEDRKSVV